MVTVRLLNLTLAVTLMVSLSSGCQTSCTTACEKALSCDLDSPRVSFDACYDDCERERTLYSDWWENDEMSDNFDDHRNCIADSTCEELRDGVCYDDALFIF